MIVTHININITHLSLIFQILTLFLTFNFDIRGVEISISIILIGIQVWTTLSELITISD